MTDFEILLEYRNSKREAAYAMYGKDWRKHIVGNRYWSSLPNDDEERAHLERVRDSKLD